MLVVVRKDTMKYEYALKNDDNGGYERVYPSSLHDAVFRESLKSETLLDSEQKVRLYPRYRKDAPHFYARSSIRRRLASKPKDTSAHDREVKSLVSFGNNADPLTVGYYDFPKGEKEFQEIYRLRDYEWDSECSYVIDRYNYVQFDVLGRSKKIGLREKQPLVAIEVVDTHFIDKKSFNKIRQMTRFNPLVVIVYFLFGEGKLNHKKYTRGNAARLRANFYIEDGSFWIGKYRLEEKHFSKKINFKSEDDYYDAVRALEVNEYIR